MSLQGATLEGAMLHTAFILSTRGIPQLYYGEELAMLGGHDPDNRKDFVGGFPGDKTDKFTKEGRTADEQKMFDETKAWIEIRKKFNALKSGKTIDLRYDENTYIFARQFTNETIVVGLNRANESDYINFDAKILGFTAKNIVCRPNGGSATFPVSNHGGVDGTIGLALPSRTAIAYECFAARK
jgi:neopullulanase